jgi:crotonobetainyl-CoA:carnitine CoA-transferase CaiB-like acyl-CoA transferase
MKKAVLPLTGLNVIELSRVLAGPWIGQVLSDLGANVIKIESPNGDETRRWGPPFIKTFDGSNLDAAYFHCCNRGKRSVTANFEDPGDLELVVQLIERADVLIENFKPEGLSRFGLDYATLAVRNPRLIYCSVTGFGQTGPLARDGGYDAMIQGMSGLMDITGESHGDPQKIGVALVDIMTGLYGVIGIQAALSHRVLTGKGQHIDVALFDVAISALANQAMNYLVSGDNPKRRGNSHPNIVPYQAITVADGFIMLAVGTDEQFRRLCEVIGEPSLPEDARYSNNTNRVENRDSLLSSLAPRFREWQRNELLNRLASAGVPAGPINTVKEAIENPHTTYRQIIGHMADVSAQSGSIPFIRTPIHFSNFELAELRRSPHLGEHDEAIRGEIAAGTDFHRTF